ncbi:uncharacterized protein EKO05_0000448 [Ascochyta rabiei]|uniref:uncharacterized protein n=1 Tax=Didymella rabiei TaxID=5454 RepID=UPI0021FB2101|nr:uncharacterized protein EKO05_0000448 [Ascochyta rabiei]UPX09765.1 hypothetical protein EKO05_0000448 [Ascochyta rabiei]
MRSFAVLAMAASASAYAYNPTYNVSSSAVESYAASTPAYAASTPVYAASTPGYAASSAPAYPVASSSTKYEEYPVTSTKVIQETTFVCPEPTVVTYEEKTYSVTKATTLTVSSYTTTVVKTTHTPEAQKPSSKVETPVYSASIPSVAPTHAPYPSSNATVPTAPQGTATGYPTGTKPATPEFTGAAAQAGVGLLAVVGALAAFL